MSRTLELPDGVYEALLDAARSGGVSPAEWIETKLPRPGGGDQHKSNQDRALERLLRHAGVIDLGHPTGADHEQIDADLARD